MNERAAKDGLSDTLIPECKVACAPQHRGPSPALHLLLLVVLFAAGGASCPRVKQEMLQPAPAVFSATPTLNEIITVVNQQNANVRTLQAERGTVSIEGVPASLNADLALELPQRLRFRAYTTWTGEEMDLGSNDQIFWMWIKHAEPKATLFARHDQYANSPVRNAIPVEPSWLLESLGFIRISPQSQIEGPYPVNSDAVEIRIHTAQGAQMLTKRLVIHSKYGWLLQQEMFDGQGRLLASATASKHQFDQTTGSALPRVLDIKVPVAQAAFRVEFDAYQINQPFRDSTQLWTMPNPAGFPLIDVAAQPMHQAARVPPPISQRGLRRLPGF